MKKGDSFKLKVSVKVKPNKAKYKKVTYKSSKKKVVKVSSKGKLTACQAGTAKITVRSKTNKKKKAVLTIVVKKSSAREENTECNGGTDSKFDGGRDNKTDKWHRRNAIADRQGDSGSDGKTDGNSRTGWHQHIDAKAICGSG